MPEPISWLRTIIIIFGLLLVIAIFIWLIYETVWQFKSAKPKKRRLLAKQYLGVFLICLTAFILAKTVFQKPLNDFYYWATGQTHITYSNNSGLNGLEDISSPPTPQ